MVKPSYNLANLAYHQFASIFLFLSKMKTLQTFLAFPQKFRQTVKQHYLIQTTKDSCILLLNVFFFRETHLLTCPRKQDTKLCLFNHNKLNGGLYDKYIIDTYNTMTRYHRTGMTALIFCLLKLSFHSHMTNGCVHLLKV